MSHKNLKYNIEWVRRCDLQPFVRNTKVHSPDQIAILAKSIDDNGFLVPIVIDKENVIRAGHCRVLAAEQLLMDEVPCIRAEHLTEEQLRAFAILDNRVNESAWNLDFLRFELTSLKDAGIELKDVGFPEYDIGSFLDNGIMPDSAFEKRTLGNAFIDKIKENKIIDEDEVKQKSVTCPDCGMVFFP